MRRWCARRTVGGEAAERIVLLVSELVTNAVMHSQAPRHEPIDLHTERRGSGVHVAVADAGSGFEPPGSDGPAEARGIGLMLLGREASRWGVERGATTRVWFDLEPV